MDNTDIVRKLKRNILFKNVSKKAFLELRDDFFTIKEYNVHDIIIEQWDIATEFYLITSGIVKITKQLSDGNETEVARRYENEFIGEFSMLENRLRSATVKCLTSVNVIVIKKSDFYKIIEGYPEVKLNIMTFLSSKLRESDLKGSELPEKEETMKEMKDYINEQHNEIDKLTSQIKHLEKKNKELQEELAEAALKIQKLKKEKEKNQITDKITGIYTKDFIVDILEREFAKSLRHSLYFSCILIHLETKGIVSEEYGSFVNDFIFHQTAKLINNDTRKEDMLCRYDDTRILIFLPNINNKQARKCAEKIRNDIIKTPFIINKKNFEFNFYMGLIDNISGNHSSVDIILRDLEMALNQAVRQGNHAIIEY